MIEEKIFTQAHLARELRRIMAEKKGTVNPPHPSSTDTYISIGYYSGIIHRAARKALEQKKVYPIRNDGGQPYLYTSTELGIIIDYIQKELESKKKAARSYKKIGLGLKELEVLRDHFKKSRSSQ